MASHPEQTSDKPPSSLKDEDSQTGNSANTNGVEDPEITNESKVSDTGSIKSPKPAETEEERDSESRDLAEDKDGAPPLPDEAPPLPAEVPPGVPTEEDDGWAPVWEASAQAFYFYNRFTGASQWTNPRVPETEVATAPGVEEPRSVISDLLNPPPPVEGTPPAGGYNPAIHGDYDPNAWYAQSSVPTDEATKAVSTDPNGQYGATAAFNRFTGRFQNSEITPENYNDENKSKRQMNAFFDVDAAANSHQGKSLKEERSGKKISKTELKQFKEKRKAKKEEKRRAWLLD